MPGRAARRDTGRTRDAEQPAPSCSSPRRSRGAPTDARAPRRAPRRGVSRSSIRFFVTSGFGALDGFRRRTHGLASPSLLILALHQHLVGRVRLFLGAREIGRRPSTRSRARAARSAAVSTRRPAAVLSRSASALARSASRTARSAAFRARRAARSSRGRQPGGWPRERSRPPPPRAFRRPSRRGRSPRSSAPSARPPRPFRRPPRRSRSSRRRPTSPRSGGSRPRRRAHPRGGEGGDQSVDAAAPVARAPRHPGRPALRAERGTAPRPRRADRRVRAG